MTGKKTFLKLFVFALFLLLFGFAAATPSEAIVVTIQNDTQVEVSVAFYYYDVNKAWIVNGWFNTDAGGRREITLISDQQNLYFYAFGGGLTWEDADGPKAAIVHDVFEYDPKKSSLSGKNLQTVGFRKLDTDGKAYTLRLFVASSPTPTPPPPVTPPPPPPVNPGGTPPKPPEDPTKPPKNQETPPKSTNPNGSFWRLVEVRNNEAEWKKSVEDGNKHPSWQTHVFVSSNSVIATFTYVDATDTFKKWLIRGGAATGEITWTDPPEWTWPNREFSSRSSIKLLKCTFNCSTHPQRHQFSHSWTIAPQLLRFDEKGNASLISYMTTKENLQSFAIGAGNAYQPFSTIFYGKFDAGKKKGERRGVIFIAYGHVRTTYIYEWM